MLQSANAALMLAQRMRRWANIKPVQAQYHDTAKNIELRGF